MAILSEKMRGAPSCCFILLMPLLGAGCTVRVEPIKLESDAQVADGGANQGSKAGFDARFASDFVGKCTGYRGVDADHDGGLAQGLVAYYPCEQASGTTLLDQSGNKKNATLASSGTGSSAGYRFAAGKVGKALYLNSANEGHVVLPPGVLADDCEATIATWVYLNSQNAWQRVWTFSTGNNVYMYLTPNNEETGVLRAGITLSANTGNDRQFLDGPATLPNGVWTHVAMVLGPAGLVLYIDGVQVAADASISLRPADLAKTSYDYIGRSNYSWDPYLDGSIDEFRIYNRALSSSEIQALANGS